MKEIIKNRITKLIEYNWIWSLLKPFAIIGRFIVSRREEYEQLEQNKLQKENKKFPKLNDDLNQVFEEKIVLTGPFQGMIYPTDKTVCSAYFPKIIGCYEKELHPYVESFCNKEYTEIIDVGCAEGYYAVGLGLRIKSAKIFAYDTSEEARQLCIQMASKNRMEDRLQMREFCSSDELKNFKFSGKNLIICDCEGFESQLFTKDNIHNLSNSDILIETHDFIDMDISPYLINLLSLTHDIQIIKSIDDIEKARTYSYIITKDTDLKTKKILFSEGRPGTMEWLVCLPKKN